MIPGDHQRAAVAAAPEKTAQLGSAVLVPATSGGRTGLDHAAGGRAAGTLQANGAGEWLPRDAVDPACFEWAPCAWKERCWS
jgi:hypothetical protein